MKVLVYGATGSQQFPVLAALQQKGAQVYATTSSETGVATLTQVGVTPVQANLADAARLREVTEGMDAVSLLIPVSLPNPADGVQYAKHAIDAARQAAVKILVWNTSGFLVPHKTGAPTIDGKQEIKAYLQASGVPYILIEPSVYAENLLAPYTVNYIRKARQVAYPTLEEMPIGWITSRDVGALVADAIYHPELAGQSFRVSGLENLTGDALAAKFSAGLGEPISYYAMPPREFGDILKTFIPEDAARGVEGFYQSMVDNRPFPTLFSEEMPAVLAKLPVAMTPIEEWVRQHKTAFLG
ncbi:SDR family oxidoreductase [Hymenobacter perfusus]|uniref:NmrA family transcriptional regulator n=1 Tax=Hymenobacter perfusus TaxID=1236770 RepID=A0A3R9MMP6_9BACT|nr:NmrA family NAD(P)-binding protein [Hymenobacter perfusus]RSK45846.1 NmrA family transcriptional regulator [Hymenobacter perfusus]